MYHMAFRVPHMRMLSFTFLLVLAVSSLYAEENGGNSGGDMPNAMLPSDAGPKEWVVEKTGEYLPLSTVFTDENGREITLGSLIDKPALILPIYFYCPSACSRNLANMAVSMNRMKFEAGADYRPIALSFSDTETAENARRAKNNYIKLVYDGFPAGEWKFLTGSAEAIKAVTDAMGFRFKRLPDSTYIHPSAVIAVGADGRIIRYVYGSLLAGDMDMAVANAKEGTPALSVKRFLEFCLSYDPDRNKPVFYYVKIAVPLLFAAGIALLFALSRKRGGRREGGDAR